MSTELPVVSATVTITIGGKPVIACDFSDKYAEDLQADVSAEITRMRSAEGFVSASPRALAFRALDAVLLNRSAARGVL